MASDLAFYSMYCGEWSSDLSPLATPSEQFNDGTHLVGSEVAAGRYRASSTSSCRWQRLSDFLGEPEPPRASISAFTPEGITWRATGFVDIAPGDAGFWSSGCGPWSADLTPRVMPGESFDDGTYLVGHEIPPGRYRASPGDSKCYWGRLSGFGMADYLPVSIGGATFTIADIAATDLAFRSNNCGTWSSDLTPLVTPGEPFGGGTFLVGPEVAPGRYRASFEQEQGFGSSVLGFCQWQRLSGFGGRTRGGASAIESGEVWMDQETIVEIAPTDIGFYSINCGTWTPAPQ